MPQKYVHPLDEYFAIRISPIDRDAAAARPKNDVLARASLLILKGRIPKMQVSGFAIKQGDKSRYVTGPSHWWVNPDAPSDADDSVDTTKKTNRKKTKGNIEFFHPADEGLWGIPYAVQEVFLEAYDAALKAAKAATAPQ